MYRANFEGSNYIPYNCTNRNCKEKIFLSDNFDIMDMCKFTSKEDKARFESIIGSETSPASRLYSTEVVPVSDDYAFVFREPSIYNIVFESALVEEDFLNKYQDLVSLLAYVDTVYRIAHTSHTLIPINSPHFNDNVTKTYKAKINSKGIAKVIVKKSALKNLKVGKKVTLKATYLKDTVKKSVRVKK